MLKKDLIILSDEISKETQNLFLNSTENNKECALLIQKLNILAHKVSENLNSICVNAQDDTILVKRTQEALTSIIEIIFNIITILNKAITNDTYSLDELKNTLCSAIGNLTLNLRFKIAFRPDLSIHNKDISHLYESLKKLDDLYNDYYTYNHLFQNTLWKFVPRIDANDTAIIIQGPVIYENDFTLETLYRYRWIYPNATIILSTWEGDIQDFFRWQAMSINVIVLESKMPEDHGISNIKLQIISSHRGIMHANLSEGIKYVLKTRTDQRIFLPDFLTYIKNMLKTFKVNSESLSDRIVFLGGYQSSCICPFELSDFLVFGHINDMIKFYDSTGESDRLIPNRMDNLDYLAKRARILRNYSHYDNYEAMKTLNDEEIRFLNQEFMEYLDPETYIPLSFYERIILKRKFCPSDNIVDHYHSFLKDCTIIIDSDHLFLYWFKYEDRYLTESSLISMGSLTTSNWMNLFYSKNCEK